jgi:adenylate cyclase
MSHRTANDHQPGGKAFRVAGWLVDPAALRISKDSQTIKLEPKAMAVLAFLAARPNEVISRQELEASLWTGSVVGYDALSNAINKLRKAFGDKARNPGIIETIPKTGFRMIAEVTQVDVKATQGKTSDSSHKPDRLPRKLAAILYADVAEYSRLTHEDEDATHHKLNEYLDLFAVQVESHRGRVMHYAGDAILAMFDAAVDAVGCASAVQQDIADRNHAIPAGRGLQFRIGINTGDVFEDRDDVFGDGVNIAARLEGLAQPGGICVSEAVRSAIGRKLGIEFQYIGEQAVKNIDEPVRSYMVGAPDADGLDPFHVSPEPPAGPSIAVLPFNNMSGDADQEYFSDGISEDITTDLSKLPGLLVIARNSAFAYKGRTVKIAEISHELGVRYVLEGSVRKSGQRVRINAQLIDGTTGGHVWAERYDRDLTDIFSVQDEVTSDIVSAISPALTSSQTQPAGQRETPVFEAYDYFLKGREYALLDTEQDMQRAQQLLQKAIDLDAEFSAAYSYLARCYALNQINNWGAEEQRSLHKALALGRKACSLNPANPHAHFTIGTTALWLKDLELARREVRACLDLDPNFSEGHAAMGMIQIYSGEPSKALDSLATAMRLDPHYRDICLHFLGQAYFHQGLYAQAAEALNRRLIRKPESDISRVLLASTYGHLGDFDKSRIEWEAALRFNPGYSIEQKRKMLPYQNPADFEQIVDGLARAGLLENS